MTTSTIIELVLGVIIAVDHLLAAIPSIAASSTFQLFTKGLTKVQAIEASSQAKKTL